MTATATIVPVELRRLTSADSTKSSGIGVAITWSDGVATELDSATLRKHCPCATCLETRGDRSHSKPLTGGGRSLLKVVSATAEEEANLQELWPVGNYAIGMRWGDGHDTGIYPFALLRKLSDATSEQ